MNIESIVETSHGTQTGAISFPEAVARLSAAGVEYYHVDYAEMRKTFYGPSGPAVVTPIAFADMPAIAPDFDRPALQEAIRDSQQHGQTYRDFSRRAMAAGVQGYFAFLRGQRVTYLGRVGDQHTEWFPGAGPAPN